MRGIEGKMEIPFYLFRNLLRSNWKPLHGSTINGPEYLQEYNANYTPCNINIGMKTFQ